MLSHCLACLWFYLGVVGSENGAFWFDLVENLESRSVADMYSRSLYWTLGHMLAAPVDATMYPQNIHERMMTLTIIFGSLVIIGSGISSLTNKLSDLSRMGAQVAEKTQRLRLQFRSMQVPGYVW